MANELAAAEGEVGRLRVELKSVIEKFDEAGDERITERASADEDLGKFLEQQEQTEDCLRYREENEAKFQQLRDIQVQANMQSESIKGLEQKLHNSNALNHTLAFSAEAAMRHAQESNQAKQDLISMTKEKDRWKKKFEDCDAVQTR